MYEIQQFKIWKEIDRDRQTWRTVSHADTEAQARRIIADTEAEHPNRILRYRRVAA